MGGRRLSVNFSSLAMKEKIQKIAEDNKTSSSKLIEELIMFRLFDYEKTDAVKDFIREGNFVVSRNVTANRKFESAIKRSKFRFGMSIRGEEGDLKRSIIVDTASSDINGFEYSPSKYRNLSELIRKAVEHDIEKMTTTEWLDNQFTSFNANLTLVFIDKIIVDFLYIPTGDVLHINYRCSSIYTIPFVFDRINDNEFVRHLDFNYIRYKPFNVYAKEGWDRRKHSHLIYIDHASKSKSAGFFIGVLYEDNGRVKDKNSLGSLDSYMTEIRIHYAHKALRINKWHIMSEVELSNINLMEDFANNMKIINKRNGRDES
ncbi:TPA: hypothetical protein ACPT1K_004969 [Klebsiella variicola]